MTFLSIHSIWTILIATTNSRHKISGIPLKKNLSIKNLIECCFNLYSEVHSLLKKQYRIDSGSFRSCPPVFLEFAFQVPTTKMVTNKTVYGSRLFHSH